MNNLANLKQEADNTREVHFRLLRAAFQTTTAKDHEEAYYAGLRAKAAHQAFIQAMQTHAQGLDNESTGG